MYSRPAEAFAAHEALIAKRQAFEAANPHEPYTLYPTTYNYYDHGGETLLLWAIRTGDLARVKQCVEKGADVKCASRTGLLPIQLAINMGQLAISEYLQAKGATFYQVDTTHCHDQTTKQWFLSQLRTLIDSELARPEEAVAGPVRRRRREFGKNFNWRTNHAFFHQDQKCISLINRLIELGDDRIKEVIEQENYRPFEAERMFVAIQHRQFPIVQQLLLCTIPIDPIKPFTDGALHKAVASGSGGNDLHYF